MHTRNVERFDLKLANAILNVVYAVPSVQSG